MADELIFYYIKISTSLIEPIYGCSVQMMFCFPRSSLCVIQQLIFCYQTHSLLVSYSKRLHKSIYGLPSLSSVPFNQDTLEFSLQGSVSSNHSFCYYIDLASDITLP